MEFGQFHAGCHKKSDLFIVHWQPSIQQGEIDKDCMFSNDYEDECATICKICTRQTQTSPSWNTHLKLTILFNRHLNFGNLGAHLHQSHGIKMRDYQEKFGEPEITRKSYHECGICHETLLFIRWLSFCWNCEHDHLHPNEWTFTSRYHLTMHVKNKHGLTIGEYNKKHMQVLITDAHQSPLATHHFTSGQSWYKVIKNFISASQCRVQWDESKFWQGKKNRDTEGVKIISISTVLA